jgi:hypothetical protein
VQVREYSDPSEYLLDDLGHTAGADGAAALTDGEPQALVHGDGLDRTGGEIGVVAARAA